MSGTDGRTGASTGKSTGLAPQGRTRRAALAPLQTRLPQLSSSNVMLGTPEIAGLVVALLLLVLAVVSYFYALVPARNRLRETQTQIAIERQALEESGSGLRQGSAQQATVEEIVASLRDFETNHLPAPAAGRQSAIEFLYAAIRRHNLRNKGQSFVEIDPAADSNTRRGAGGARLQKVFPALNMAVAVEGSYTDVRRFIRDIEASDQFIVVDSVEIEGVRDTDARAAGANTSVGLNLSMTAYFRPASSATDAPVDNSAHDASAAAAAAIIARDTSR